MCSKSVLLLAAAWMGVPVSEVRYDPMMCRFYAKGQWIDRGTLAVDVPAKGQGQTVPASAGAAESRDWLPVDDETAKRLSGDFYHDDGFGRK